MEPAILSSPADAFVAAVREPISPSVPTGDDPVRDEEVQRIRTEIERLEAVGIHVDHGRVLKGERGPVKGESGPDFDGVVAQARPLLLRRSKDLYLAAYLTVALAHTRKAEGLHEGMAVTHALAETFWEGLHPQKPVRRTNALQFLADKVKEWLAGRTFGAAELSALEGARAATSALQAWTEERMGEGAPAWAGLQQALEEACRAAARAAALAPPAGAATPSLTPETPSSPPPQTPPDAGTNGGAMTAVPAAGPATLRSPAEAERQVLGAAEFLRRRAPTSALAYRLPRAVRWGPISAALAGAGGRTALDPFPPQRKGYLEGLQERGEALALLSAAEETFADHPLWLDLQRLLVEAADALGAEFAPAKDALLHELDGLLQRCPTLATLSFSDGTPLADEATRVWLDARRASARGTGRPSPLARPMRPGVPLPAAMPAQDPTADEGEAGETGVGAPPVDAVGASAARADALFEEGDFEGALHALLAEAAQDRTARDAFRRRLYLASLCMRGERFEVARPLLDGLAEEAGRHRLDAWEPTLAAEVWALLHACCAALLVGAPGPEQPALRARGNTAFEQLCRIDAARGLALLEQGP